MLLVPVLGSTLGTPAVLQLGPTDPHPSAPLSAPQAVDVAPVTSSADHHPLPTSPAYVSATGLDGASSRSSGRPSRPPAPSPLDTKRLVASRTGGPALVRPPPNFRTLLQPPKLAGQKVGIKRYSPFWRAIRSSMTAFTALCPCGSLRGAPGGFARLFVSGLPTSPLSSLGVPRAVPHSGHCTRLQGQACQATDRWPPNDVSRCRLIRRHRDPQQGQFGIATELRWSLARPPDTPDFRIGRWCPRLVRCSSFRTSGAPPSILVELQSPRLFELGEYFVVPHSGHNKILRVA